jgi:hypothetical protein
MKAAKLSFLFVICCLNLALFAQKQDNNETKTISFNKDAQGCYKVGMWYYPVTKPDTLIQWSMIALWKPESIVQQLEDAKKNGFQVIAYLAVPGKLYQNEDKTFNLSKFKQRIDLFKDVDLEKYHRAGVLQGIFLMDEPMHDEVWGGQKISCDTLEAAAKYCKDLWPSLKVGTQTNMKPMVAWGKKFKYLDFVIVQYRGSRDDKKGVADFVNRQRELAEICGVEPVFGMNYYMWTQARTVAPTEDLLSSAKLLMKENKNYPLMMWKYDEKNPDRMPGLTDMLKKLRKTSCGRQ